MICDLVEAYHVFDWRELPLDTAATLAAGLGPGSRSEGVRHGLRVPMRDFLTALCADRLALLFCYATGENCPTLFADGMIAESTTAAPETGQFASAEEFEACREKMMAGR